MSPVCFALSDGASGNERQVLALGAAMALEPRVFRIALGAPWSWLAPHLRAGAWRALPAELRSATAASPPALVIGCGRSAALATALLRRHCGSYAIQILDPRAALAHWDTVIAPRHDRLHGAALIETVGALNAVTPARLETALAASPELLALPAPRTALLVGGSNRAQRIDRAYLDGLLGELARAHAGGGGSFLVTTSRRTDPALLPMLAAFVTRHGGRLWRDERDGANPYFAFLAAATRIVATPDSVNLLSEAATSGKPLYSYCAERLRGKLAAFHQALRDGNHLRDLARLDDAWQPTPLRETQAVADEVWRRYRAAHAR